MEKKTVDYIMEELKIAARKLHQDFSSRKQFNYKTVESKRLKVAATRAMDVADGEAPWVKTIEQLLLKDKPFGGANEFRIRLGYKNSIGGFVHARGHSNYYVICITREGLVSSGTSPNASQVDGD